MDPLRKPIWYHSLGNSHTDATETTYNSGMAVASGPAGPVLAGPVSRSFLELRMRR